MHSGTGSVYEIMLKMRVIALSWTEGDQELADDLVAKALKKAIDEVPETDRLDIDDWLMDLLRQTHEAPIAHGSYSAAGIRREEAPIKLADKR
jgi:hypothetical protein